MNQLPAKRKSAPRRPVSLILALLLSVLLLTPPFTVSAKGSVIRVGYVETPGVLVENGGTHTGYIADYLNEVTARTGWQIEYIPGSFTENIQRVREGELDLMCLVRDTEERRDYFLYSELPMAYACTELYALSGSDFYFQDHDAFDGCRIGAMEGSIYEDALLAHAAEVGFDCELVYFEFASEMEAALSAGEIDLFVSDSLTQYSTTCKLVDRFAVEPTFFVTGLDNESLMAELDAAMQFIRMEYPDLDITLTEKYFSGTASSALHLTREEQEYIDTVGPITVKGFDGRRPLGYVDNEGNFTGILADYLDVLAAATGLEFIHEQSAPVSLTENASLMAEEGFALLFVSQSLTELGLSDTLHCSAPLFQTGLSCVVSADASGLAGREDYSFAINSEMSYVGGILLGENPNYQIFYYENSMDCMDAVLSGDVDMTIQDENVVTYLLQKPRYADGLTVMADDFLVDDMCLYAPEEHALLVSIINKTLGYFSEGQLASFQSAATIQHSYQYEIEDLFFEHGKWITFSLLLLLIIVVLCAVVYARIVQLNTQKKETDELKDRIQLDELTGLYNRQAFFNHARQMVDRTDEDIYLIRINISNFKIVNDIHGTEQGDSLLRDYGRFLKAICDARDSIAGRFSADHFYICITAANFDEREFDHHLSISWLDMDVTLTYGIYPVGNQRDIPIQLMCDRADLANSSTNNQSEGGYIRYYSDEERQRLLREREIEQEMERAISERQFCLYIQPKYDIATEEIVGGEALVRWLHPQKGMIFPGEFIGLFERNGFIRNLDYYVWEECCHFIAASKANGLPTFPISVNVSRVHFYGTALIGKLTGLLDKYRLRPEELELEITESICADDPRLIFSTCNKLRDLGFKISMDDFGSGYSSLNMLKEMPLDIIKMDMRFLRDDGNSEHREKGRSILSALITMAHALKFTVVVEGLETAEQRDFISALGNCTAQGYFYSRPVDCNRYQQMCMEAHHD